ncbi:MAG: hypothetical protein OEZ68_17395 [Gammaproteobacteria bacterium]|nr:hypothetical protein [Gammaproteobacteria bacterium]MDH5802579.1 hypothetical protein [Gammaproteobacteria bacterium]
MIKIILPLILYFFSVTCSAAESFQSKINLEMYAISDNFGNQTQARSIDGTYYSYEIDPDFYPISDAGHLSRSSYVRFYYELSNYDLPQTMQEGETKAHSVYWRYADPDSNTGWSLSRSQFKTNTGNEGVSHSLGFLQYLGDGLKSISMSYSRSDYAYNKVGGIDNDTMTSYAVTYYSVPDLTQSNVGLRVAYNSSRELEDNGITYTSYAFSLQPKLYLSAKTNVSFRYLNIYSDFTTTRGSRYSLNLETFPVSSLSLNFYGSSFISNYANTYNKTSYALSIGYWF